MRHRKSIFLFLFIASLQAFAQAPNVYHFHIRAQKPIPTPQPTPNPPSQQAYTKETNTGKPIHYYIEGLGTNSVNAYYVSNGRSFDVNNDMQARSDGQDRAYSHLETLFDECTGFQWNWVGSKRSGGRTIQPQGIGDVNVEYLNDFDCAAKKHDIQWWLANNFEDGAMVSLKINDSWVQYEVKNFWNTPLKIDANVEVIREFIKATEDTLNKALQLAKVAQKPMFRRLQTKLHSINPFYQKEAICTVLTNRTFKPFLEPEQADKSEPIRTTPSTGANRRIVDKSLIGNVGEDKIEAGCGCGLARNEKPGQTIFTSQHEEPIWMKIDGEEVQLTLISSTQPERRGPKGNRFTEIYSANDITVKIDYTVTDVVHEGTGYNAIITVTKGNRMQTIRAVGGCGC